MECTTFHIYGMNVHEVQCNANINCFLITDNFWALLIVIPNKENINMILFKIYVVHYN